jgi:hypothetical protein
MLPSAPASRCSTDMPRGVCWDPCRGLTSTPQSCESVTPLGGVVADPHDSKGLDLLGAPNLGSGIEDDRSGVALSQEPVRSEYLTRRVCR